MSIKTHPKPSHELEESPREDQAILQQLSNIVPTRRRRPKHASFFEQVRVRGQDEQEDQSHGHIVQPVLERWDFVERGCGEVCDAEEGKDYGDEGGRFVRLVHGHDVRLH